MTKPRLVIQIVTIVVASISVPSVSNERAMEQSEGAGLFGSRAQPVAVATPASRILRPKEETAIAKALQTARKKFGKVQQEDGTLDRRVRRILEKLEQRDTHNLSVEHDLIKAIDMVEVKVRSQSKSPAIAQNVHVLEEDMKKQSDLQRRELQDSTELKERAAALDHKEEQSAVTQIAEEAIRTHSKGLKVTASIAKLSAAEVEVLLKWQNARLQLQSEPVELGEDPSELVSAQQAMENEMMKIESKEDTTTATTARASGTPQVDRAPKKKAVQLERTKPQVNSLGDQVYDEMQRALSDMKQLATQAQDGTKKEIHQDHDWLSDAK